MTSETSPTGSGRDFLFGGLPESDSSNRSAFSGNDLDRRAELRSEAGVAEAMADPARRIAILSGRRFLLAPETRGGEAAIWHDPAELERLTIAQAHEPLLLGWRDERPCLAVAAPEDENHPDLSEAVELRELYSQGLLGPADESAAGQAVSWSQWHRGHGFCPACGAPTVMELGGVKRRCESCERQYFPRIDPVVIMLVTDGKRALLGRSPHFPEGIYSCLAGFVEHGETMEMAVRRETFEEAGIEVGRIRYHASQPWPFPHSLMIGVFAEAKSEQIRFHDQELEDCRWFERDDVAALQERRFGGAPNAADADAKAVRRSGPPRGAIASLLIADWLNWTR